LKTEPLPKDGVPPSPAALNLGTHRSRPQKVGYQLERWGDVWSSKLSVQASVSNTSLYGKFRRSHITPTLQLVPHLPRFERWVPRLSAGGLGGTPSFGSGSVLKGYVDPDRSARWDLALGGVRPSSARPHRHCWSQTHFRTFPEPNTDPKQVVWGHGPKL